MMPIISLQQLDVCGERQFGQTESSKQRRDLLPVGIEVFYGIQSRIQVSSRFGGGDFKQIFLPLHPKPTRQLQRQL